MTSSRLRSLVLVAALLALAGGTAFAFGSKGTSGAPFLKIGPGARPAAMGEAFSAVADDVHAIYYNPAGLSRIGTWEFSGMHTQYFQSIDYNFIAMAVPVEKLVKRSTGTWSAYKGSVGLAVYNLSISDIERRGNTDVDEPIGTFDADDTAIALSYGRKLNAKLSLGGAAKFIRQTLDGRHATAFAADLGALYSYHERLDLAGGVRNMGSSPKFVSQSDPLPLTGYLGAAYDLDEKLTLSMDVGMPRDRGPTVGMGLEYSRAVFEDARGAFRAGYLTRNTGGDGLGGVSAGVGLRMRRMGFDFAWVPFGDLGNTFRYSLLLRF